MDRKNTLLVDTGLTLPAGKTLSMAVGIRISVNPDSFMQVGCKGFTSIEIPEGVTGIDNSTFAGCSGLTDIVIHESVTSIGGSAFSGCSAGLYIFRYCS